MLLFRTSFELIKAYLASLGLKGPLANATPCHVFHRNTLPYHTQQKFSICAIGVDRKPILHPPRCNHHNVRSVLVLMKRRRKDDQPRIASPMLAQPFLAWQIARPASSLHLCSSSQVQYALDQLFVDVFGPSSDRSVPHTIV